MLVSLLLLTAFASTPADTTARAAALTHRAIQEYKDGELDQALVDAQNAYALEPLPSLLYNLGQIHRALHHWEKAARYYRQYLGEVPNAPNQASVEGFIRQMDVKLLERSEPGAPPPPPQPVVDSPVAAPAEPAPAAPMLVDRPKPHVPHLAILDIQPHGGVTNDITQAMTLLVVHDVRKVAHGVAVVGADEIRSMLGLEHQKQLFGCTDLSCLAEIGGALGAERILMGSLSRFGGTYVLDLKILDARNAKALAEASSRAKNEDDFPNMVDRAMADLFPGSVDAAALTGPAPRPTHALAWTLFVAGGVAAGFAVYGAVKVANVQGAINQLSPTADATTYQANIGTALNGQANASYWQIAAIALGVVAAAAAVTGVLTW